MVQVGLIKDHVDHKNNIFSVYSICNSNFKTIWLTKQPFYKKKRIPSDDYNICHGICVMFDLISCFCCKFVIYLVIDKCTSTLINLNVCKPKFKYWNIYVKLYLKI